MQIYFTLQVMKILHLLLSLLAASIVITFPSCSGIHEIDVGEIEDINFTRVAGRGIEFEVVMPIENPSSFRFRITGVDLDVYINKEYIGKITNVDNILVPAGSSDLYAFPLKVEFSGIITGLRTMFTLFTDRQAEVTVTGNIGVRSFPITRKIPVEETTHVTLQR
jgi:LEA14-like dessication related protein